MQISVSMMIAHSASKCHSKNRQNVKKERGIACERGRFRPRVRRAALPRRGGGCKRAGVRWRLQAYGGRLAAYEEPSEAGAVKTLLRFADGRVTLTRRGAVRSEMTFAAGECHTIFYELPLGRLTMELHTDSVCASFDGACGTLELCYRLTVRDETVSENRLTVTLAPR